MKKSHQILKDNFNIRKMNSDILKEFLNAIIDEENIEEYIKEFVIDNNIKYKEFYSISDRSLILNCNRVIQSLYTWNSSNQKIDSEKQLGRFYNLFLLQKIYHLINHVLQKKLADEDGNASLDIIVQEGVELEKRLPNNLKSQEEILYSMFFDHILIERNADIMSLYNILELNEETNIFNNRELEYIKEKLNRKIRLGYSGTDNPVKTYYRLRDKMDEYCNIKFNEEYSDIEVISWGMPMDISKKEKVLGKRN